MASVKFMRQPTVAGTPIKMEFDVAGIEFLVKNLTDGDIYVAMGDIDTTDLTVAKEACVLIPEGTAQVLTAYNGIYLCTEETVTIIPDTTSEKGVEVQCLKW